MRCQQVSPTSLESQGLIGYLFGQSLFRSVGGDQSQGGSHLIDTLFFVLGQIPTVAASVGIDAQGLDATVDGVPLGAYLASSGLECRKVHPDVWASHDLGQTVERVERVRQSQADGLEASGGVMFDVVLGFVEQVVDHGGVKEGEGAEVFGREGRNWVGHVVYSSCRLTWPYTGRFCADDSDDTTLTVVARRDVTAANGMLPRVTSRTSWCEAWVWQRRRGTVLCLVKCS